MSSELDCDPVDGFAKRFGENLARRRKLARMSQEQLSVRASLHRTAVGQLERGERVARTDTLVKLGGAPDDGQGGRVPGSPPAWSTEAALPPS